MLNSISWGQYITAVIILVILYYLYVGFRYFRWEILGLAGIKKVNDDTIAIPAMPIHKSSLQTENPENYLPKPALEIDISPLVQSFTDEAKAYLQEAAGNIQKEDILSSLQVIAAKYPVLKDADCKDEVIEHVQKEVDKQYPNLLQPGDLNQLWK